MRSIKNNKTVNAFASPLSATKTRQKPSQATLDSAEKQAEIDEVASTGDESSDSASNIREMMSQDREQSDSGLHRSVSLSESSLISKSPSAFSKPIPL